MTGTAEVLNSAATVVGQLSQQSAGDILKYVIAGFSILLGGVLGQHLIEGIVAKFNPPFLIKLGMPTILSSLCGAALKWSGLDTQTATEASIMLAGWIHTVNESPLAASLEGKIKSMVGKAAVGTAVAILLLLSVQAKAESIGGWCAGPGVWAGSVLYQSTDGGLAPQESAMAGFQYSGYLGSWQGDVFTPSWTLGLIGGVDTAGALNHPAAGIQGGWYLSGVPVTAFVVRRLDVGASGVEVGLGTGVQFSGWVPFLYAGKPGN